MTLRAKHSKNSTVPDGADSNLVRPSDWNADHPIRMTGPSIAGRIASGDGDATEIQLGDDLVFAGGKLEVAVLDATGGAQFDPGFRDIPQVVQNANATFALADRGKHWLKNNTTAYTWTLPLNSSVAFPIGTAIVVVNDSGTGAVTIARTAGVALLDGATDANFTLAVNTARTLLKIGTDRWRVL